MSVLFYLEKKIFSNSHLIWNNKHDCRIDRVRKQDHEGMTIVCAAENLAGTSYQLVKLVVVDEQSKETNRAFGNLCSVPT